MPRLVKDLASMALVQPMQVKLGFMGDFYFTLDSAWPTESLIEQFEVTLEISIPPVKAKHFKFT